jgi:hypothetical protein
MDREALIAALAACGMDSRLITPAVPTELLRAVFAWSRRLAAVRLLSASVKAVTRQLLDERGKNSRRSRPADEERNQAILANLDSNASIAQVARRHGVSFEVVKGVKRRARKHRASQPIVIRID